MWFTPLRVLTAALLLPLLSQTLILTRRNTLRPVVSKPHVKRWLRISMRWARWLSDFVIQVSDKIANNLCSMSWISTWGTVQWSRKKQGLVHPVESSSTETAYQRDNSGKFWMLVCTLVSSIWRRSWIFLSLELKALRLACADLKISPKITVIVVGKRHHVRFFPRNDADADKSGNCPAGTVVDREVANPAEFDFYLQSHGGLLGTSRPAHYNILCDENNFTYVSLPYTDHCS